MIRPLSTLRLLLMLLPLAGLLSCAPSGVFHTVEPGQTLYRIAMIYEVDEAELARVNKIDDPTQLRVKQKVFVPGVTRVRRVPATAVASRPAPAPPKPAATAPRQETPRKQSVKAPPKKAKSTPAKAVKGLFAWPAKGKLLSRFGARGEKVNKGIEIDLPKGSGVRAAASGKVIYSGNAIPGYGNLIILEHSDNYFSVYGYNHKNLVKLDDFVGQGDKIALSGLPPNGQSARLHFEIRQGKSAVDPILFLPSP